MITPQRDLRSAGSLWLNDRQTALRHRSRPARQVYDIAIVGAGVSGALAASAIADLGKSVVILDRRGPATGSTAASTAMIQWEIDKTLGELAQTFGEDRAAAIYRSSLAGLVSLRRQVIAQRIDCDWVDRTALTVSGDAIGQRGLKAELGLREKHGLPCYWLDGRDLRTGYGIDRTAALVNGMNAELHPVKLTRALLKRAIESGMELVAPADVTAITASTRHVTLGLNNGTELRVAKLIMCSGYEALPQIPKSNYRLISTWALATAPMRDLTMLPARPLIWEQSDPYLYLRTAPDNRIVAGGEDASFVDADKRDALIPRKAATILRKLKLLLPEFKGEVEYAWAGTFADSPTGLPSIGPVPGLPNVFATLGAGGNGITFSQIAANIAREWVRGRRHRDQALFAFG